MHYAAAVEVLPKHTADNPVIVPLHFAAGTLTGVNIIFPPGCVRRVCIQIYHGVNQILPTEPGTYYAEDSTNIPIQENLSFDTGSNLFYIVGWNVGCYYRHKVDVHFEVRDVSEYTTAEALIYMTEMIAILSERIRGYS